MQIDVSGEAYRLRLMLGRIIVNGQATASLVDHDKREIQVSDQIPAELRMSVAAVAVSEAWQHRLAGRSMVRMVGVVS